MKRAQTYKNRASNRLKRAPTHGIRASSHMRSEHVPIRCVHQTAEHQTLIRLWSSTVVNHT